MGTTQATCRSCKKVVKNVVVADEDFYCDECSDIERHGECRTLVCSMCSRVMVNDKGYIEKALRTHVCCERCADIQREKIEKKELFKMILNGHIYLFPSEMKDAIEDVMSRQKALK